MYMVAAALVIAAAMIAFPTLWRLAMPITDPFQNSIARFATAQANYDAKLAAGIKAGVDPLQAQLDAANVTIAQQDAHITQLATDMADSEAAVMAQATAMLADSSAAPVVPVADPAPAPVATDPTVADPAAAPVA
ncbi:MAG: hypothetical protein ACRYG4_00515 [Janthinobacterium lividum]